MWQITIKCISYHFMNHPFQGETLVQKSYKCSVYFPKPSDSHLRVPTQRNFINSSQASCRGAHFFFLETQLTPPDVLSGCPKPYQTPVRGLVFSPTSKDLNLLLLIYLKLPPAQIISQVKQMSKVIWPMEPEMVAGWATSQVSHRKSRFRQRLHQGTWEKDSLEQSKHWFSLPQFYNLFIL